MTKEIKKEEDQNRERKRKDQTRKVEAKRETTQEH
jgi:hypothetical protein